MISSTGAKAVSRSRLPETFQGIYTLQYNILCLFSERLLHIQTCSRTNLQQATTDSKAVLRHPKICCCCWLCSWFYFSQCQRLSTTTLVLHPGLGWAQPWTGGRARKECRGCAARFMQQFTDQSPHLRCEPLLNPNEVRVGWQGCSVWWQGYLRRQTQRILQNCMKTFWWQWWHLPKRWNHTPNRPHYPFSTHRPLILLAAVWHDDDISILWKGNKRQKKINYFLKAARDIFLQRCGLVSPKSHINTLHKGCSSSCRLGLCDQKFSMTAGTYWYQALQRPCRTQVLHSVCRLRHW